MAGGRLDAPPTAPTRVDRAKWWLDAVKIEKLYMAPRYAGCLMIGVGTGGVFGCYGAERLRHWLQTLGARAEPVQAGLGAGACLLYTSPSPRDGLLSRMPSSA